MAGTPMAAAAIDRTELIAARATAATEGPWMLRSDGRVARTAVSTGEQKGIVASAANPDVGEFIAHAREDIPWLLQKLTEQSSTIEAVRKLLARKSYELMDPELKRAWEMLDALTTSTTDSVRAVKADATPTKYDPPLDLVCAVEGLPPGAHESGATWLSNPDQSRTRTEEAHQVHHR